MKRVTVGRIFQTLLSLMLLGFFYPCYAQESPASVAGAKIVTAVEAKQLIDKGVPVFDLRTPTEYAEGHIKGAALVAYKEKSAKEVNFKAEEDSFDLSKLPSDKNAPLVFYCAGVNCWKSFKGGTVAVKAGYKNLSILRGGYPEWKEKGFPLE